MVSLINTTTPLALVTALAAYVLSIAVYRVFLHPLAKFPGPKLAAATRWYEGYFDIIRGGQYTWHIAKLHREYGPIIRISPHELHVSDPNFYGTLYQRDGRWNKYDWAYDAWGIEGSHFTTVDHSIHKQRRAPLSRHFSKANVTNRQDIIFNCIDRLCERIEEYIDSQTVMELGTAISAMVADVTTEFILGKSYNNLDRTDFNENLTIAIKGIGSIWLFNKHVRFALYLMKAMPPAWLAKSGDPGMVAYFEFMKSSHAQTKDMADAIASEDRASIPSHNLVNDILLANLPESEKRLSRLQNEIQTIMGAGFETTAQVLRFIVFHTYTNPEILKRLRSEINERFGSLGVTESKKMSISQLESLPYLTSVLMEGLRLSPGVASRLARIAPDRDILYDGKWIIPAGTPVGMTVLLIHLDETIFPNPTKFDPDRWMDSEEQLKNQKYFWPFSSGTRDCLGRQLAWGELYVVIATLVSRFDLEFVETGPDEVDSAVDRFVIGTKSSKGFKARIRRADR